MREPTWSQRDTFLRIQGQMRLRPEFLFSLSSRRLCPLSRRTRVGALRVQVKGDGVKVLEQPNEEERHFVIGELLTEAYARPGIER